MYMFYVQHRRNLKSVFGVPRLYTSHLKPVEATYTLALIALANLLFLWENLTAQVEHRQWAWDANSLTNCKNGKVPPRNQSKEAKPTGYSQKHVDVFKVRLGPMRSKIEVCSSNERE